MKQTILLGGYTNKANKGIAAITLDTEKKRLENYVTLVKADKSTYLLEKGGMIYTCIQNGEFGGMAKVENGNITDQVDLGSGSPCHISWDEERKQFYLANYHDSRLSVVQETTGGLKETERIVHVGSSVHPNQEKAHVHFAQISPCGRFLFVCDLGTDEVYLYEPSANGTLKEYSRFKTPAGFGPRHLAFHPDKPLVYVLGELSSQILVLAADPESGKLSQQQIITMLPEDFKDFSAGAAIRITRDGRFLYASNRGHNSIVIYGIREDGSLQLLDHIPTYGDFPRDFMLDGSERFLVVAHQKSDDLTLFERDLVTGKLTLCQKNVYAPECVCVCFTEVKK
ncbi:lactonase family protein [Clostridiales bacterium COT073_COT-073]|nr:lactonase family protein [Clostridiales bacterium COT073_COT-073]